MEWPADKSLDFIALLRKKTIRLTRHMQAQLEPRHISLAALRLDLQESQPYAYQEQPCLTEGERQFLLYYLQRGEYYHAYVIVVDGELRVVTAWRPSRIRQKGISSGKLKVIERR